MAVESFVVVGAGLAGARAVETLRDEGFGGRLTLVGAEPVPPYDRPPLSKDFLAGSKDRSSLDLLSPAWFTDQEVTLRAGAAVVSLELGDRTVVLDDGTSLGFDRLLLATGSRPRQLPVPGADLEGVRYLRTVDDSGRLRDDLAGGGRRVVVVGGGWIGLEVAAAARGYGNDVTLVEPQPTVLHAALGAELGEVFAGLHRDHGVDLRTGTGASALRGDGGRVTGVVTDAGDEVDADLVVVGIGAVPRTELAEAAGLEVDNGVVVDEHLRTSHPDVFAAGDIARSYYPSLGRRVRVEHWENARASGPAAARAMLGGSEPYDPVPYFFTDQYDLGMEFAGDLGGTDGRGYDDVVVRGDLAGREFVAFWLRGGRVVAGMNVNVWDVNDDIKALVRSGGQVDAARLADPDVPLSGLR